MEFFHPIPEALQERYPIQLIFISGDTPIHTQGILPDQWMI